MKNMRSYPSNTYQFNPDTNSISYCTIKDWRIASRLKWDAINTNISIIPYSNVYISDSGDFFINNLPNIDNIDIINFYVSMIIFSEHKNKPLTIKDVNKFMNIYNVKKESFYLKFTGLPLSKLGSTLKNAEAVYKFKNDNLYMVIKTEDPKNIYIYGEICKKDILKN